MSYIIVLPQGNLSSYERAEAITRELYCITVPNDIQEDYQKEGIVFNLVKHPDNVQTALHIDLDFVIPVNSFANLSKLVSLFPELTEEEKTDLQSYILSSEKFVFANIIPSTTTVRDYQYMVDNGWFEELDFF
jgi:hypothetical protein